MCWGLCVEAVAYKGLFTAPPGQVWAEYSSTSHKTSDRTEWSALFLCKFI